MNRSDREKVLELCNNVVTPDDALKAVDAIYKITVFKPRGRPKGWKREILSGNPVSERIDVV